MSIVIGCDSFLALRNVRNGDLGRRLDGERVMVWVDLESPAPAKAVPFAVRIDGQPVDVDDGIPWDARRSLLATDPRLCLVDLSTGDCAPVDQGIPNEAPDRSAGDVLDLQRAVSGFSRS